MYALGIEMLVHLVTTEAIDPETRKMEKLEEPAYQLTYLDNNGVVNIMSNVFEQFLSPIKESDKK